MSKKEEKDAIDFATMNVPRLFSRLFIPTLLSMLFSAMLNLADGMFVGHFVGSDALAAINIVAPLFTFFTGLGMLLGSGVSVVAAVHMSHGNQKAANINVTQALTIGMLVTVILLVTIACHPTYINTVFGGSARLEPMVVDYMLRVLVCLGSLVLCVIGMFVIRLDGSPRYAMYTNVIPAVLNIFLDWLFICQLGWGLKGAAVATSLSYSIGALMVLTYFAWSSNKIQLYKPKFSRHALQLTLRNLGYIVQLGFSTFLGEVAVSCTMIVGNYTFMRMLHEDGVAAFSVACYLFPLIFMFGNAVSQSALPIISYNNGVGLMHRVRQSLRVSLLIGLLGGIAITLIGIFCNGPLVSLFLSTSTVAYGIGVAGLPWFALGWLLVSLNLILIGYYQALERAKCAIFFMLLRGFVFVVPCFVFLPQVLHTLGLWLAVPVSELLTLGGIVGWWYSKKYWSGQRHVR